MFRSINNNNKGQAMLAEYGVLILLVAAAVATMTVYFKRSVQAKIFDARNYMINDAYTRSGGNFVGSLGYEYEPYYVDTDSTVRALKDHTETLQGGLTSGIYDKTVDDTKRVISSGETLPPRDWPATEP